MMWMLIARRCMTCDTSGMPCSSLQLRTQRLVICLVEMLVPIMISLQSSEEIDLPGPASLTPFEARMASMHSKKESFTRAISRDYLPRKTKSVHAGDVVCLMYSKVTFREAHLFVLVISVFFKSFPKEQKTEAPALPQKGMTYASEVIRRSSTGVPFSMELKKLYGT